MQLIPNGLKLHVMCNHQNFEILSLITIMGEIRLKELEPQHCQ